MSKLQASDSIALFQLVGVEIKKTELDDTLNSDEFGGPSKTVEIKSNSIITHWESGDGAIADETIKRGGNKDMLQFWNYSYTMGAASMAAGSYTIVVAQKDSRCSVVAELPGLKKETIQLKNKTHLIVTQYEEFRSGSNQVGYISIAIYNPVSNSITKSQTLGYCRAPRFNPIPNNYYAEEVDFEIKDNEKLNLVIEESFTFYNHDVNPTRKGTSKRFYQFNELKNQFEEIKSEEVTEE